MSEKHVEAINVLKEELEQIVAKVKLLRKAVAGLALVAAIQEDKRYGKVYFGMRYERELRAQLQRGEAIMASIKFLEGDN
ncbi:hypothetical protein SEA_ATUIN_217 [Arthrobacter phage Atuin]|nr:hypothetical protein SEA_ATUIN_16 [Arthrobacter phage Atuin]